ncbi:MAG: hypothetical protein RL701_3586 [Pseudomonadota bacterium]
MQSFPLLALALALFAGLNLVAGINTKPWYRSEAFNVNLMSGEVWHITSGDVFLGFSMLLLFVEIIRSTRSSSESILNHALACLVFVGALSLFLTHPGYGNSVFFLFMGMTLLDFMAGFIITAVTARRDHTFGF